jgi:hypothetical protein
MIDAQFGFGVAYVGLGEARKPWAKIPESLYENEEVGPKLKALREKDGGEIKRKRPVLHRLPPESVFWDPLAQTLEEARFFGHWVLKDQDDLIEEAKKEGSTWNLEAIKSMQPESRKDSGPGPDRKQVKLYVVWVPECHCEGSDSLCYGTVFHLAEMTSGAQGYVRDPIPMYGHESGPYEVFGVLPVPGCSVPLAPMQGSWAQHKDLNAQVSAQSISSLRRKTVVLTDDSNADAAEALESAKDGSIVSVDAFESAKASFFTLGGPDADRQAYIEVVRDRVDRSLGLSDAIRGTVTGVGTATENSIAGQAAENRIGYVQKKMWDATASVLNKVAWYFFHEERIIVKDDDGGWFIGGDTEGMSFADLEITLELESMERVSQSGEIAKANQMMQAYINAASLALQAPFVNWKGVLDGYGQAYGIENAGRFWDAELQGEMAQGAATQSGSPPVLRMGGQSNTQQMGAAQKTEKAPAMSGVSSGPGRPGMRSAGT